MAVLVEAISVIVRRDSIEDRLSGGWREFVASVPNETLCADDALARVGFMSPADCGAFAKGLEGAGLTFFHEGEFVDFAVVDQVRGPTAQAKWLGFDRLSIDEAGNKVSACWLLTESSLAFGQQPRVREMTLAVPGGWAYADSLSARFQFIETEEIRDKLEFLRHENGLDVYLERSTGKELYMGRTDD